VVRPAGGGAPRTDDGRELAVAWKQHVRSLEAENEALIQQGIAQARKLEEIQQENEALLEAVARQADRLRQLEATLEMLALADERLDAASA
jgi:hypothetical protein